MANCASALGKWETTLTGRGEARRRPRGWRIVSVPDIGTTWRTAIVVGNIALSVVDAVPGVASVHVPNDRQSRPRRGAHGLPWAPSIRALVVGLGGTRGQPESGHCGSARQQRPDSGAPHGAGGVHVVLPSTYQRRPFAGLRIACARTPIVSNQVSSGCRVDIWGRSRWRITRGGRTPLARSSRNSCETLAFAR